VTDWVRLIEEHTRKALSHGSALVAVFELGKQVDALSVGGCARGAAWVLWSREL
jgi:hypothetical protein